MRGIALQPQASEPEATWPQAQLDLGRAGGHRAEIDIRFVLCAWTVGWQQQQLVGQEQGRTGWTWSG